MARPLAVGSVWFSFLVPHQSPYVAQGLNITTVMRPLFQKGEVKVKGRSGKSGKSPSEVYGKKLLQTKIELEKEREQNMRKDLRIKELEGWLRERMDSGERLLHGID